MKNPLTNYSVNDLQRLGGLKDHCSAPLLCVAHGLNVPCDLCELEEDHAAVCTACYKLFKEYPKVTLNRPCASIAQFQAQGVIAFEDEARAALEAQARPRAAETLGRQETVPSQQHRGSQAPKVRHPEAAAHKNPVSEEHRRPKDEPARSVTPKPDRAETAKAERT